jgi:hypothetical protein
MKDGFTFGLTVDYGAWDNFCRWSDKDKQNWFDKTEAYLKANRISSIARNCLDNSVCGDLKQSAANGEALGRELVSIWNNPDVAALVARELSKLTRAPFSTAPRFLLELDDGGFRNMYISSSSWYTTGNLILHICREGRFLKISLADGKQGRARIGANQSRDCTERLLAITRCL